MNKQKLIVLIIATIGVIATFLPWAIFDMNKTLYFNGTNIYEGWVTFGLFALVIAFASMGKKKKPLKDSYKILTMISGVVAAVIAIINIIGMRGNISEVNIELKEKFSTGFGLWLVVVCGFALVAAIYLMREKKPAKTNSTSSESKDLTDANAT